MPAPTHEAPLQVAPMTPAKPAAPPSAAATAAAKPLPSGAGDPNQAARPKRNEIPKEPAKTDKDKQQAAVHKKDRDGKETKQAVAKDAAKEVAKDAAKERAHPPRDEQPRVARSRPYYGPRSYPPPYYGGEPVDEPRGYPPPWYGRGGPYAGGYYPGMRGPMPW